MATPTYILPANGYFIAEENTATGIIPQSGANLGTVVAAPITGEVGVGEQVMFRNNNVVVFKQSGSYFSVIPLENILLTYTGAPS